MVLLLMTQVRSAPMLVRSQWPIFRGSPVFFWLPQAPRHMCHVHTDTHVHINNSHESEQGILHPWEDYELVLIEMVMTAVCSIKCCYFARVPDTWYWQMVPDTLKSFVCLFLFVESVSSQASLSLVVLLPEVLGLQTCILMLSFALISQLLVHSLIWCEYICAYVHTEVRGWCQVFSLLLSALEFEKKSFSKLECVHWVGWLSSEY